MPHDLWLMAYGLWLMVEFLPVKKACGTLFGLARSKGAAASGRLSYASHRPTKGVSMRSKHTINLAVRAHIRRPVACRRMPPRNCVLDYTKIIYRMVLGVKQKLFCEQIAFGGAMAVSAPSCGGTRTVSR